MAQPARLLAGPALELGITEGLLGPDLGGDHIRLLHCKTGLAGQGQKGLQIERVGVVVELARQLGIPIGMGQEGIELLQAHHGSAGRSCPSEP